MEFEFSANQVTQLVSAQTDPKENQTAPAVVATTSTNAKSPNNAENPVPGSPSNTSVNAAGIALKVPSGIKKSNMTLSHACDTGTYVSGLVNQAAAFGGQIIQAIRKAIRAVLDFFGLSPSSSYLVNKLKYIATQIADAAKFIKDITSAINGYLVYVKQIQQMISYILSLPAQLIAYFADCITTLKKQLVASFKSAISDTGTNDSGLSDAIKSVQSSIKIGRAHV